MTATWASCRRGKKIQRPPTARCVQPELLSLHILAQRLSAGTHFPFKGLLVNIPKDEKCTDRMIQKNKGRQSVSLLGLWGVGVTGFHSSVPGGSQELYSWAMGIPRSGAGPMNGDQSVTNHSEKETSQLVFSHQSEPLPSSWGKSFFQGRQEGGAAASFSQPDQCGGKRWGVLWLSRKEGDRHRSSCTYGKGEFCAAREFPLDGDTEAA